LKQKLINAIRNGYLVERAEQQDEIRSVAVLDLDLLLLISMKHWIVFPSNACGPPRGIVPLVNSGTNNTYAFSPNFEVSLSLTI
jgi:hypothetical protein